MVKLLNKTNSTIIFRKFYDLILLTLVMIIIALTISSCYVGSYSMVQMEVKSYRDPEFDYTPIKRFALVKANEEYPLIEKELLSLVKRELIADGYYYDDINPDILIVIDFYVGSREYYEPPKTIRIPYYVKGKTKRTTGWVGGNYVTLTEQADGHYETAEIKVKSGGLRTEYYRNIDVRFIDAEHLEKTGEIELLWRGKVDSYGKNSDIGIVAPVLLDEILSEYPFRTSDDPHRIRYTSYETPIESDSSRKQKQD